MSQPFPLYAEFLISICLNSTSCSFVAALFISVWTAADHPSLQLEFSPFRQSQTFSIPFNQAYWLPLIWLWISPFCLWVLLLPRWCRISPPNRTRFLPSNRQLTICWYLHRVMYSTMFIILCDTELLLRLFSESPMYKTAPMPRCTTFLFPNGILLFWTFSLVLPNLSVLFLLLHWYCHLLLV